MAMHFLRLSVHRVGAGSGGPEAAQARVVVTALDLFRALEQTVDVLLVAGWVVDDLDQFRIDVQVRADEADPCLRKLILDARADGIAWAVDTEDRHDCGVGTSEAFPVAEGVPQPRFA